MSLSGGSEPPGGSDPGGRGLSALGDLLDKLSPTAAKLLGLTALTVMVLTGAIVVHSVTSSKSSPSAGVSPPPSSQGGAEAATSVPTPGGGVVYLHVVAYNRPPCTVTPMFNITVDPDVNQPNAPEERPGDAYPGPCHWDLPFRPGTVLTFSLRDTSHNGWAVPYQWSVSGCEGTFTSTRDHPLPTEQETYCKVTLSADATLNVSYQTYAYGIDHGASYYVTAVYPKCLPAFTSPNQQPAPQPCQGG